MQRDSDLGSASAAGAAPRGLSAGAAVAVVIALGLAAYSNSFAVPFQFDDGRYVVGRDLAAFFSSVPRPSRIVAHFSFAANGSFGAGPFGYHLVNLAVHLATAVVLLGLVRFVCLAATPPDAALRRRATAAALLAAALFVAHPLQTQAVTYVVQRMASLAALCYLAATLAYGHAGVAAQGARRALLYGVALALAALAFFTKENTFTLVAVLAVLDVLFLSGTWRARVARLAPFAALTVAAALALNPAAMAHATGKEFAGAAAPVAEAAGAPATSAWQTYALTQPGVVLRYLRLLAVPVGQNVDHDPPIHSTFAPEVMLACAALAALLAVPWALAWRARRRSAVARAVAFGIGAFVASLLVESSVIPIQDAMVEHRMYLPSAGIFLALACAVTRAADGLGRRARVLAACAGAAWVVALAAAAFARNEVWRDPATLWADAAEKSPALSRPWVFLGEHRLKLGDAAGAIPLLEHATGLRPRTPHALLNLGLAYAQVGRAAEAERAFRDGIALVTPALPRAHLGLGNLLLAQGRVGEACDEFRAEVAVDPRGREARANLVVCSLSAGDAAGALAQAEQLEAEDPGDARVLFNLGVAADAAGDAERAARAYQRFLAVAGPDLAPQREAARRWLAGRGVAEGSGRP